MTWSRAIKYRKGLATVVPGLVEAIHRKDKASGWPGLPKTPVPEVAIGSHGVAGDYNWWRERQKNGDRRYALLIHTTETLQEIRDQGWPVEAGHLGENILVSGIPYHDFTPGSRWAAGAVEFQIVKACDPCDTLAQLDYVGDQRVTQMMKDLMGRRGWYAEVTASGIVRQGDTVQRLDASP